MSDIQANHGKQVIKLPKYNMNHFYVEQFYLYEYENKRNLEIDHNDITDIGCFTLPCNLST